MMPLGSTWVGLRGHVAAGALRTGSEGGAGGDSEGARLRAAGLPAGRPGVPEEAGGPEAHARLAWGRYGAEAISLAV